MKKFCSVILLALLLIGSFSQGAWAADKSQDILIEMDGMLLNPDVSPMIQSSRILIPFRTVAEALNLQVKWNSDAQEIGVDGNGVLLKMYIGSNQAVKNGVTIPLDTPPFIIANTTMVPIRFISEVFGCQVNWDAGASMVRISSPPLPMTVIGYYGLGDEKSSSWTNLFADKYPKSSKGNTDIIQELELCWYTMDEEGRLLTRSDSGWQRPDGWNDVLAAASSYKLGVEMCVQMTDEKGRIRKMINNDTARKMAIKNMVNEAALYKGVNLDFEGLGYKDTPEELSKVRSDFTRFVNELASSLHSSGKTLTLSLHALNTAYPGYDYTALGKLADHIIIMAYDYGPNPEPNDLVEQAVKLATASVSGDKLWLGISAGNESEISMKSKLGIAKRYRLGGIALWRLGVISDDLWKVLRK